MERRLAAILAADVVGYSRLMGEDEAGTFERLRALRKRQVEPRIAARGGRIVKLMGDGILAEFPSVVEAVACAVEIQHDIAEAEAARTEERRIRLRMGINLGDVIVEDADIYGDGVNVAARLEGLARPGGICISGTVFEHVKGKVGLEFADLGARRVKNIAEPVRVYRVALDGALGEGADAPTGDGADIPAPAPAAPPAALEPPDRPSIVVLPFANLSGDPEQDCFADGIVEDIITELSREPDLFVIARTSSFAYKGASPDLRRVGRELGVRYVLEGSVRRAGERVRLTAQLIEAATNRHLWAERYDRRLEDAFAVQDELTSTIHNTLLQKVRESGIARALARAPADMSAYDHVLRGLGLLLRFGRDDTRAARAEALAALDLAPGYARAYAVLAWSWLNAVWSSWADDVGEAVERGFEAARAAVAADGSDFWAHAALGFAELCRHRHDRALAALDRALQLNPNSADARAMRAMVLNYLGRPDEGLADIALAMRHNPHYPDWYLIGLGRALYMLGRFDEALAPLERLVTERPELAPGRLMLIAVHAASGRLDAARAEVAACLAVDPAMTVSKVGRIVPFQSAADLARYLDLLRGAGLPDG